MKNHAIQIAEKHNLIYHLSDDGNHVTVQREKRPDSMSSVNDKFYMDCVSNSTGFISDTPYRKEVVDGEYRN